MIAHTDRGLNFNDIRMLVFDIDGILTDGRIYISEEGLETKTFFAHDGAGIKIAMKMGLKVGFISSRISNAAKIRARELGIDFYMEGRKDKLESIKPVLSEHNLDLANIFYMGDDIVDIELLKRAGISASVPNAPEYIRNFADIVTEKAGGQGAVREICDLILERKGLLPEFLSRFK